MLNKTKYIILILILIAGFAARFYQLNSYPELNADEAALGYNAYSLLMTSRDEFGTPWPITFRSFDDYKPGVYVYLSLPFIKLVGLTPLAVRLPSLTFSLLSLVFIYFLVLRLFPTNRHKTLIALASSAILALNPWHIHFSRGAWETQVATSFLLIATYFLTLVVKNKNYLFPGIIFYFLALYTYHSMRVIVPLFIVFWLFRYHKIWLKHKRYLLTGFILCVLLSLPLINQITGKSGISRAQGVSIFADTGPEWRANELRSYHSLPSPLLVRLAYNKPLQYAHKFFANYLDHYSLQYLFYSGDVIERNRVPDFGQLLLVCFPFLLLGIWYIIRQTPKRWPVLVFWLIVAPIPSALTFQSPHAVRSFALTIPLAIITAYGLVNFIISIANHYRSIFSVGTSIFIIVIFAFDFSRYLISYHLLLPYQYPMASQTGFLDLVNYIKPIQDDYQKIYITDRYDQPYILFLFFSKYPPEQFQTQAQVSTRDKFGFGTVRNYDNLYFQPIDYELLKVTNEKTLLIGTPQEIPSNANIIHNITDKYGRIIFSLVQIN